MIYFASVLRTTFTLYVLFIIISFSTFFFFIDQVLPLSADDGVLLSDIQLQQQRHSRGGGGVTRTDVADLEGSVMNDYIDVHGEMMSLLDDNNGGDSGAGVGDTKKNKKGSVAGSVQGETK